MAGCTKSNSQQFFTLKVGLNIRSSGIGLLTKFRTTLTGKILEITATLSEEIACYFK